MRIPFLRSVSLYALLFAAAYVTIELSFETAEHILQPAVLTATIRASTKNEREKNMIILIAGASHTGKTSLAQRLLEKYRFPYLSIDHLKMGLIRSGATALTPLSSVTELTAYLWPIVSEMIKTAIENEQNLIVEGCYIPPDWDAAFTPLYRHQIQYICLVMSENYITKHYEDICRFSGVIEKRQDDADCTVKFLLRENRAVLEGCRRHHIRPVLMDEEYTVNTALEETEDALQRAKAERLL